MRTKRLAVCCALVLATAIVSRLGAAPPAPVVDLARLPLTIGSWHGQDTPVDEDVVRQLGADSYTNRTYERDGLPVGLYVAFYAGQTPGDSIHSPLNCLPGTGWEPVAVSSIAAGAASPGGRLRRMIVRKDEQEDLVLYWYQVHGRMIANEWRSKAALLADSIRLRRSDAGFVRLAVPIRSSSPTAESEALAFAAAVQPSLDHLWSR
jgi:EpsI family protein